MKNVFHGSFSVHFLVTNDVDQYGNQFDNNFYVLKKKNDDHPFK